MSDVRDRREFLVTAICAGAGVPAALAAADTSPRRPAFAGVDDLGLPPEARADLEAFAESVLRDVAWLSELPLDGIDPAFIFVPRG